MAPSKLYYHFSDRANFNANNTYHCRLSAPTANDVEVDGLGRPRKVIVGRGSRLLSELPRHLQSSLATFPSQVEECSSADAKALPRAVPMVSSHGQHYQDAHPPPLPPPVQRRQFAENAKKDKNMKEILFTNGGHHHTEDHGVKTEATKATSRRGSTSQTYSSTFRFG